MMTLTMTFLNSRLLALKVNENKGLGLIFYFDNLSKQSMLALSGNLARMDGLAGCY